MLSHSASLPVKNTVTSDEQPEKAEFPTERAGVTTNNPKFAIGYAFVFCVNNEFIRE